MLHDLSVWLVCATWLVCLTCLRYTTCLFDLSALHDLSVWLVCPTWLVCLTRLPYVTLQPIRPIPQSTVILDLVNCRLRCAPPKLACVAWMLLTAFVHNMCCLNVVNGLCAQSIEKGLFGTLVALCGKTLSLELFMEISGASRQCIDGGGNWWS